MTIYNTGTVSVTNGNAVVTGSGTAWAVALISGGMFSSAGLSIPILSVGSDTSLTLAYAWPGTTASGSVYAIAQENSEAADIVNLNGRLAQVLVKLSLIGIHPDNSGTLTKRNALTLGASDDNYIFLRAELGVEFAFYRWDGPTLAWIGPFTVADAVAGGGVSSLVGGTGITVDATNPAIPVVKLADMTANRVRGRITSTGAPQELTLSQVLDMIGGAAQGDILYRGSATWSRLAAGTALQSLRMNSAANAPQWMNAREVLTAARTYYVRTDGNDSNNGLANTAGGAFLTVQKAIDVAASLDTSIYDVTIQLGAGTYDIGNVGLIGKNTVGAGSINIVGNEASPSTVVLRLTGSLSGSVAVLVCQNLSTIYKVRGFRLESTGSGGNPFGLQSVGSSRLEFQNLDFGAGLLHHLRASDGAILFASGPYSISGSTLAGGLHLAGVGGAVIRVQSQTVTFSGTVSFGCFANATTGAIIFGNSNTFAGTFASATGTRYQTDGNAVILTNGAGPNYFPGNAAGVATNGGQYI
ncbi:hypothetical protein [Mesorhizobium sp. WSM3864]|uniref:hypothetical protein n=1 Tax=Mesorhizobium sp. WSM3864 TaxID=2029404 RepID=UPI001FE175FA|nr:hypothetical protein [Mesorhizobium sp. WSM3864]